MNTNTEADARDQMPASDYFDQLEKHNEQTTTINEADRATARRVIRRHVGARDPRSTPRNEISCVGGDTGPRWERWSGTIVIGEETLDAACLAAAQGRAYAKALRGAR